MKTLDDRPKLMYTYEDVMHGQKVLVSRYEPADNNTPRISGKFVDVDSHLLTKLIEQYDEPLPEALAEFDDNGI